MRRTTEKFITALLIILMLFNFIYSNYVPVYGGVEDVVNVLVNLLGGVVGIFTWIPRLIAMAVGLAANILTAQVAYMDGATAGNNSFIGRITITPFEIFFNKVQILDVNFLDTSVTGTTGTIRTAVAKWYYIVRLIAIAILMIILLYVGIRMAIASVASEKAAYKRSLVDWVVSLALVFVLHYIVMFTVNANSAIVKALEAVTVNDGVGDAIMKIATTSLGASWEAVASTVVYCMIVFQTFVFLVKYLKRMLTVGFLIIISPLISITYSLDKMGDGKAQALNTWLKEFIYNVLIQPFHCIMYMAFVDTAFGILSRGDTSSFWSMLPFSMSNGIANAILAILCIKFIDDGEKIVRKIFGFDQASSLGALETAAMAATVTQGGKAAVGMAQNARKGINFAKEKGAFKQVGKDVAKIKGKLNAAVDNSKINRLTKQNMKSGKYKTERGARNNATKQVQAQRKLKDMKSANTTKRNKKIEEQMKKDYGGTAKQFEQFMAKVKQGDPKAIEKYNERFDAASKKVPMTNHKGKNISKPLGNVGKFVKGAWNSNTGKYIRKTMVPAGIGLALGGMAYGGTNLFTSVGAGNAVYKGVKEFQKNSTKTIAGEAKNYVPSDIGTRSELEKHINEVEGKGDNGAYDKNSEQSSALRANLQAAIDKINQAFRDAGKPTITTNADALAGIISKEMLQNPDTFDLNTILSKNLGSLEATSDSGIQSAAQELARHAQEGFLYNQINHANDMGVSKETLIDKIDDVVSYEKIDVNNVVTHIQKSENVEEVINRVDSSELDQMIPSIEKRINELVEEVNKRGITKDIQTEMDKLQNAAQSIKTKLGEK